jgi:hypothetical protein
MEEFKPGQVISPQSAVPTPDESAAAPPLAPTTAASAPNPAPPVEPVASTPVPATTPEADGWQFRSEAVPAGAPATSDFDAPADTPPVDLPDQLSWTASEFIAHEKSAGWYSLLALAALAVAALIYWLTRDKISTGVVIFAAIALGIFAAHKPKTQQYALSQDGLHVGQKLYGFQGFKSFSVGEEGAIASIVFMPLKRFMPPLTIYVAPDIEDQVVNFLADYLPFEQHKTDAVDNLLRRIRF